MDDFLLDEKYCCHHKRTFSVWDNQKANFFTWFSGQGNVMHETGGLSKVSQRCIVPCWICMSCWLNTSELSPPSTNRTDDLICYLAIISVLDLKRKGERKRGWVGGGWGFTMDVGMSVDWSGNVSGAEGSGDFWVWPLLSALWMSSSIFIDPL